MTESDQSDCQSGDCSAMTMTLRRTVSGVSCRVVSLVLKSEHRTRRHMCLWPESEIYDENACEGGHWGGRNC